MLKKYGGSCIATPETVTGSKRLYPTEYPAAATEPIGGQCDLHSQYFAGGYLSTLEEMNRAGAKGSEPVRRPFWPVNNGRTRVSLRA